MGTLSVIEFSERELKHLTRSDRVRRHTRPQIREQLDREILLRLRQFGAAPPGAIDRRILELEREWDVERVVSVLAAAVSLLGIGIAALLRPEWLVIPLFALAFLLLQAVDGWSPLVPILRVFGVRTRREIDVEKFALKALRGDFGSAAALPSAEPMGVAAAAAGSPS